MTLQPSPSPPMSSRRSEEDGMNEKTMREQLGIIHDLLRRNEEEHAALVDLLRGFEGMLRVTPDVSESSETVDPKQEHP